MTGRKISVRWQKNKCTVVLRNVSTLLQSSLRSPTPKPQEDFHPAEVSQSPLPLTYLPREVPVTYILLIRANVLCPDMAD